MTITEISCLTAIKPYEGRTYELLENLYSEYNRREYVSPDPLEFLYHYDVPADREVVGLIASSLAYGRVASILSSVGKVLSVLGRSPAGTLAESEEDVLADRLRGFVHRFTACEEMAKFLYGIGRALRQHGSLEKLFLSGLRDDTTQTNDAPGRGNQKKVIDAMESFASTLLGYSGLELSHLLPRPSKGSACKRLFLYARWMTRHDDVDPGGWNGVLPCDIIVPLDTHMFRIASGLGFVSRKNADGRAAIDATEGFSRLRPDDPVRYDFALTRFGIRTGMSVEELLSKFDKR
ncbi:MAG: TIGR02757 family protein [Synergistaceae bacterium]|nr:TIGR02757 family protein [Synergistaceae bacterium]